jgi:pimeloyl-ACP methyl ester carboxylesterase
MNTVISSDATPIAVQTWGHGPAVVFVGGAFQKRDDATLTGLAELLAPDFQVFSYDRRGRGDSGDVPSAYSPEQEVADLAAVLKEAGGEAKVFGTSSGAVLALDAAASGLAVTHLAVYEPPFVVDDSRPPVRPSYIDELTGLLSDDRRGDAVELFMGQVVGIPAEYVAGMRQAPFWADMEAVAPTLRYDAAIMGTTMSGRPLPTDRWAQVTAPTLVLDGGASPDWLGAGAEQLAGILVRPERRTLPEQSHDVSAEVLAPVLRDFFNR